MKAPERDYEYHERIAIMIEDGKVSAHRAIEVAEEEYQERQKKRLTDVRQMKHNAGQ